MTETLANLRPYPIVFFSKTFLTLSGSNRCNGIMNYQHFESSVLTSNGKQQELWNFIVQGNFYLKQLVEGNSCFGTFDIKETRYMWFALFSFGLCDTLE